MNHCRHRRLALTICFLALLIFHRQDAWAQLNMDLENPPFNYAETEADNRISRLIGKLASKELALEYTREHGYLRSLLAALDIHESSQTLVFSKTSMRVRVISRHNPRAIFFNDDTYVAWVNGSSLVEIFRSCLKPKQGCLRVGRRFH